MSKIEITRTMVLSDTVTDNQTSTIGEPSIANNGPHLLFTGNWFAAKSTNNGKDWSYVSPYDYFPPASNGFCCDQTLLYDKSRDLTFWILQYDKVNGGNTLRLAVKKGRTLNNDDWDIWDLTPKSLNSAWTNQWLDYNHASVSDNFLYIGTNVFSTSDVFQRCVIIRIPLDKLKTGTGITYNLFETRTEFSLRCVQGAKKTMYFASHTSANNVIRVFSWPENSLTVKRTDVMITPWSGGNTYVAKCPDGSNWLGRTDYRITGAWLADGILGFMWTANARGTSRPFPHVRVVRIDAATFKLIDEPDLWHPNYAFAYPDAAPNAAGDIGICLFMGGGTKFPSHVVGGFDKLTKGWKLKLARAGTQGPLDNKWGDYLTVRPLSPDNKEWIAAGYTLQGGRTEDKIQAHAVQFRLV